MLVRNITIFGHIKTATHIYLFFKKNFVVLKRCLQLCMRNVKIRHTNMIYISHTSWRLKTAGVKWFLLRDLSPKFHFFFLSRFGFLSTPTFFIPTYFIKKLVHFTPIPESFSSYMYAYVFSLHLYALTFSHNFKQPKTEKLSYRASNGYTNCIDSS